MVYQNIDARKLSSEKQQELIQKYVNSGWIFTGNWNLSIHQWLSFTWPHENDPPEM